MENSKTKLSTFLSDTEAVMPIALRIGIAFFLLSVVIGIAFHDSFLPLGAFFFVSTALLLLLMGDGLKSSPMVALLLVGGVILGLVLMFYGAGDITATIKDKHYTSSLGASVEEILKDRDQKGAKFLAYDESKGCFRRTWLPDQYRAENADEVGGVLSVKTDSVAVGHYSNGDEARRYVVTISLRQNGKELMTETIYGSDPPETITRKTLAFWDNKHYGSMPSDEKIAAVCVSMIEKYQQA